MQPFCQNTRKLCQSLAKGKSQRAPTPVQSLKALWAGVSSKNRQNNLLKIQCVALSDHWGESYFKILVAISDRTLVSCRGLRRVACARRLKYADHLVQPYMCNWRWWVLRTFKKGTNQLNTECAWHIVETCMCDFERKRNKTTDHCLFENCRLLSFAGAYNINAIGRKNGVGDHENYLLTKIR